VRWSGLRGESGDQPDVPREGGAPAPLGQLIGAIAGRRGWHRRLEGARIHERWNEIAGEQLAAHTEPVRLHGGVLVLRAESPAWATQVRYLTADLVQRANDVLGDGQVATVQIVTGPARGTTDRAP
jgi:predicted nucleic acid-binding Zn ribbon protein